MPSQASYPRKYYSVLFADLDTIPLKEGNVIATYDTDGFYYDVGNPAGSGTNVLRRKANGIEFVGNALPEGRHEATTIFVVETGTMLDEDGNSVKTYSGYRWNDDLTPPDFEEVFNNLRDFQVKSVSSASTQAYVVGSVSSSDNIGTLIKNPNIYLTSTGSKIHAGLEGNADTATEATHAAEATLATRAINDNASTPKPITGYLNDVATDATTNLGSTLTFTKGDGTTKSVRVSDTKYSVFTSTAAGLVNGTNIVAPSDTTGLLLSGSGWINSSDVTIGTATNAINDSRSQQIDSTYIKSASYNTVTHNLTITKGDNTSSAINIPDTTYSVFTSSANGLVPKSSGTGDNTRYLRGDGTWQSIPNYKGATSSAAGVAGLVPAAASGDVSKYLRSDGSWNGVFAVGSAGLVPSVAAADTGKFLRGDGTWAEAAGASNTAGSNQDTAKLFLVGTKSQTTGTTGIQSYSNSAIYTQNNKLYSNSDEVVTLSATQNLLNKTFGTENYELKEACSRDIATTLSEISKEGFSGDGSTTVFNLFSTPDPDKITSVYIDNVLQSDSTYSIQIGEPSTITFTSAPADATIIEVNYYDTEYDSNAVPDAGTVVEYIPVALYSALDNMSLTDASVIAELYDDANSYAVNDFCTYKAPGSVYSLYRCTSATTGDFDPTKWSSVTVADVISAIPPAPSADGTYTLKVTVAGGVPTYSWG